MKDFSLQIFKDLLIKLKKNGYKFIPFKLYNDLSDKVVILRHDVDRLPNNSLQTAEIENELGIFGTYYFRTIPGSFCDKIIRKIENLGHEIGYHYEDVDFILRDRKSEVKDRNGLIDEDKLIDLSYKSFCGNLEKMRSIADVKTICMHGSPLSKYDNKIMWQKYNYFKLNICGEPYLDLNWDEYCYLTDTGRRWNGDKLNVRDKVNSKYKFDFKTTFDIINKIEHLPNKIMITIHPQRWSNNFFEWSKELISQSLKNIIKKYIFVKN